MLPNTVRYLIESGHSAPSADNSQPWHFLWDGTTLTINYDKQRVGGLTFPAENAGTLLSLGAVLENITQAADFSETQISTEFCSTNNNHSNSIINIHVSSSKKSSENTSIHPLFQRHTNRFSFSLEQIPQNILECIRGFAEGNARIAAFDKRVPIKKIASLIRSASEVRFQTQEVHEWLGSCLRYTEQDVKKADGLDIKTLDLPPGGKYFLRFVSDWNRMKILNRIGIYKLMAGIDSKPVSHSPVVVGITGSTGRRGALDAGRLLSRVWIYLNSVGIAVHPYFVVSDQLTRLKEKKVPNHLVIQVKATKTLCDQLFELAADETLYMLLRIGYPTYHPPRSLRLPLERVFTDLTVDT